jgi:hypothetical protein
MPAGEQSWLAEVEAQQNPASPSNNDGREIEQKNEQGKKGLGHLKAQSKLQQA